MAAKRREKESNEERERQQKIGVRKTAIRRESIKKAK